MAKKKFDKVPGPVAQKIIRYLTEKNDRDAILVITRMGQWKCHNHSLISPLTAGFVIATLQLKEIAGSCHSKELQGEWIFVLPHNLNLYKDLKH